MRPGSKRTAIPEYVEKFFETRDGHIAITYRDNRLPDAEFGYTYRVYATDLFRSRASFRAETRQVLHWAAQNGSTCHILEEHFEGAFCKCRRGDYIVFTMTDPCSYYLECHGLLPKATLSVA